MKLDIEYLGKAQPHCNKGKSINHSAGSCKEKEKNPQCYFLSKIWYLLLDW